MTHLHRLTLAVGCCVLLSSPLLAAEENPRVKATREKMLPAKLKLDIDKKMLRASITDELPAAVKEAAYVETAYA